MKGRRDETRKGFTELSEDVMLRVESMGKYGLCNSLDNGISSVYYLKKKERLAVKRCI